MKYELTKDKRVLIIINDGGSESSIPVAQIAKNIAALEAQKKQQIDRYDQQIKTMNDYQAQVKKLS